MQVECWLCARQAFLGCAYIQYLRKKSLACRHKERGDPPCISRGRQVGR